MKSKTRTKKTDTSPTVSQNNKITSELTIKDRSDLTPKQVEILKTALDKNTKCIFIDGIFGSGKTWLATLASLKLLNQKKVDQILYIRNPVESSTTGKLGFLKGDINEKIGPYADIFLDKLEELLPKSQVDYLQKDNRIECIPLGFTRGKSWNCKAIIVDEASCMSYADILLLLTRCGEFTKVFFIGDQKNQSDIKNGGLGEMMSKFNDEISKENGIFCFELNEKEDIVRSKFVRFILEHLGIVK